MENQTNSHLSYLTYFVDIRFPVIVLAIVFGFLTPLLAIIEGLSLLDAFYYTVMMLTTGSGDIVAMTVAGKLVMLLMILGGLIVVISILLTIFYYVRLGQHYERELSAQ